jgi:hypothetical protein
MKAIVLASMFSSIMFILSGNRHELSRLTIRKPILVDGSLGDDMPLAVALRRTRVREHGRVFVRMSNEAVKSADQLRRFVRRVCLWCLSLGPRRAIHLKSLLPPFLTAVDSLPSRLIPVKPTVPPDLSCLYLLSASRKWSGSNGPRSRSLTTGSPSPSLPKASSFLSPVGSFSAAASHSF